MTTFDFAVPRICSAPTGTGLDGKFFVVRGIPDKTSEYLHKDGVWRWSTLNEKGRYTGYFRSKAVAETALRKFQ
jgi:hypothetical protein